MGVPRMAMPRIFRILLIEDDLLVQYAMTEGLTEAGHVVAVVATVNEAVQALSASPAFDIITLDLCLGTEHGEDIFVRLRQLGIAFAPVLIISAEMDNEIRRVARIIPTSHYLRKPVTIQQICDLADMAVA